MARGCASFPAQAGYCNERDLSEPEARGIDGYVATGGDAGKHPATHRMAEKPAAPTGRERYAQRERLSEAPSGRTGEALGFPRSGVRDLGACIVGRQYIETEVRIILE